MALHSMWSLQWHKKAECGHLKGYDDVYFSQEYSDEEKSRLRELERECDEDRRRTGSRYMSVYWFCRHCGDACYLAQANALPGLHD
jgi:hypothetical protein